MSKAKHTPGRWHFDERQVGMSDCASVEALTDDGKMVTREICTVLLDDDDPSEDAANARLIAAAPDLLAALIALYDATTDGRNELIRAARVGAIKAMGKAEGQQ